MSRIRTVKPGLAGHEGMFDLEIETGLPMRFAWCMLFTACDREGRFSWRPRTLKVQVLPHDNIDFSRVLDAWLTRGFIVKYRVGHEWFGWIPTWRRHQVVNNREAASELPSFDIADEVKDLRNQNDNQGEDDSKPRVVDACATREARGLSGREGKGREGNVGDAAGTATQNGSNLPLEKPSGRSIRATRLPDDWTLTDDFRTEAIRRGVPEAKIPLTADKFKNFWHAKPGKDAVKLDWFATWSNWCIGDVERQPVANGNRRASPDWPDL